METVKCPKCGKPYTITKEQLPKSNRIVFPCLGCKHPITYELLSDSAVDDSYQQQQASTRTNKTKTKDPQGYIILSGDSLKEKIFKDLNTLPPFSEVISKSLELMAQPESELRDIADILETDQAIVSNILKIANSAFYGLKGEVSSIHKACVLLGMRRLRETVIIAGVSNLLGKSLKGYRLEAGKLRMHSVASAVCARIIAEKERTELKNDAYVAGLIHDIGKVLLDQHILDRMSDFKEFMKDGNRPYFAAEKEILGFDHAQIAYDLCIEWNFPKNIASAVLYHHHPLASQQDVISYIVYLADVTAKACGFGQGEEIYTPAFEEGILEFLSFQDNDIEQLKAELKQEMEQEKMLFV